ncbi:hypothetical protein AAFF_G00024640 [Aldrovandia affinis]|uniref:KIAA0825 n=1 Tax=Aldrovandia affinis TaxID=143900 RepID=A0AAD7WZ08_9TELE|nr:hypothetical protein AAFF_G00024640 [Aldrovandia affinis]
MEWQGVFPQDHAFVDCGISGLPGDLDVQQLLRDTEEKLKLNACCIEQSLKELQMKLGDSFTGDKASTPADCLQWFSPRNLSLLKPNCSGQQQLLDFLRALQQFLRMEEEGREEVALQLLLDVSSQCGVAFPSPAPLTSLHPPPSSPVHAVREEASLDVQEVWEDIRLLLRRHLLDKLQTAVEGREGASSVPQCLQQLLFLYPEAEVLSRYRSLRAKAVQNLLQSAQSSSPAETGFDRLASGFQAAAPALCHMIGDDLRALSTVAEPPVVLAFVNKALLGTVSRELCILVEKLCENALKDNTTIGKSGRSSAKCKAAVVPQDAPRRGRSFCLTSHQLRCLTLLAATLLDLEERVEELVADLGFLCCAGENPCSMRGILKKTKEDAETTLQECSRSSTDISLQAPEAMALEFDWRAALRELALPMAHCVKVVLENVCAKSLQEEDSARASGSDLVALGNVPPMTCLEREPPKMITKFCGDIMEELDALFPLVLLCREDSLLDVRASFVEAAGKVTSAVLGRLQERGREGPASAPLKNVPVLLASGVYVQQRLCHYEAQLKGSPRMPLSLLPIQKCQELTGALQEHLTGYCVQACTTCILQDPESHHWGDPKPFYEGERCSFSIQMWHYFLTGLRSDLWAVLPSGQAQEVLGQVLSHTLEVLVQRYSQACPSYNRSQQIRTDITAILLCVEQLMWSVCDSPQALVRPDSYTRPWVSSIHSLCNQLLSVLAIVTSPLTALYKTFQRGPWSVTETQSYHASTQWLCHISPALFSGEPVRMLVAGELAVLGQMRLVSGQPCCRYNLLLQALLHSDCLLFQVLLNESHFSADDGAEDPLENHQDGDAFVEAVFSVLSTLNYFPKALALVLEGYFDKRHLWDHLYNLADSGQAEPAVLRCVRATVIEPISSIVGQLVAMVMSWQASEGHSTPLLRQDVPESVLSKVPKEWNYMPRDKRRESGKSCTGLVMQAVSCVFANLPSLVASVPLPVRFLFHVAEKRLSQNSRQLKPMGLLLWGLLSCLCRSLEDGNALESLTGHPLDRGGKEKLALVAECLQGAMGQQKGVPKPTVHKVLQTLEEQRPKWSSTQLQKARKLCSESAFQPAETSVPLERGTAPELTEQKISLMVLEICHKPGGSEYLRRIYHIIQLNEELLACRLSAALAGPSPAAPQAPALTLSLEGIGPHGPRPRFNPLVQFNHIGVKEFDQSAISERNWDWAQLLPSYQGMSQVTLRTLLANRWDLQDGAVLEDEERALVDLLRKVYFNDSPGS